MDGNKVQKKVTENRQTQTTDYLGRFQYLDGKLDFLPHAEGYVKAVHTGETTEYHYVYNYTDHLGNIRLSYGRDPETNEVAILKESHYYPFGLQHNGCVGTHRTTSIIEEIGGSNRVGLIPVRNYLDDSYRYTFGGKEEQPELGLNWIDHHARNYMPDLGRWMNVDPLAEEAPGWTPYRAFFNNPIRYIDPTGMLEDDYGLDKDGNINLLRKTDDANDKLIALDANGNETNTSIEVDKGILNNKYSQTGKDSGGNTFSYDIIKVKGDEKATHLFEFAANNTNVEWSQTQLGEAGENGLNYLTTSHDKATERGVTQMINTQFHDGYTIRGHIHNHPGNTPYPSGLNDGTGDIGFSTSVSNWYNKKYPGRATPSFKIYTPGNGSYINYNKNSTMSEFMSIQLPEVILKN